MIEAVVIQKDREECGMGMQNFRYAPAWDELCHIISIHSPRAYRSLREHLPMPSERTFRTREARQPRFPLEICPRTFDLVDDHLKAIDYHGPTSLSCDDTKLFSTFRLYYDGQEKCHFLIGGVDGPVRVLDPENLTELLDSLKDKKATKVGIHASVSLSFTLAF